MARMDDESGRAGRPVASSLKAIFKDQYVLLLAVRPGEETLLCGGFIAESCARGRPPLVCVVADGSSAAADPAFSDEVAQQRAARSRAATAMLDLPEERLVLFGLYDGTVPQTGVLFDRVVTAVADIARRYDCDVLCAPWSAQATGDDAAVTRLAAAVAARANTALVWYGAAVVPPAAASVARLDITALAARKRLAAELITAGAPANNDIASGNAQLSEVFLIHPVAHDGVKSLARDVSRSLSETVT